MRTSWTSHGRMLCLTALLACCMTLSCSNDRRLDLTLVLRDDLAVYPSEPCAVPEDDPQGEVCRFAFDEQIWRDKSDRRAVVPARKLLVTYVAQGYGDFECGDRTVHDAWSFRADPLPPPDSDPFRLELDDGSVVVLSEAEGLEVSNFSDSCMDYSGKWRGVAGDLDERTGTFRMINDSVQIVLHLVEE
jgi:hypothetical protein